MKGETSWSSRLQLCSSSGWGPSWVSASHTVRSHVQMPTISKRVWGCATLHNATECHRQHQSSCLRRTIPFVVAIVSTKSEIVPCSRENSLIMRSCLSCWPWTCSIKTFSKVLTNSWNVVMSHIRQNVSKFWCIFVFFFSVVFKGWAQQSRPPPLQEARNYFFLL